MRKISLQSALFVMLAACLTGLWGLFLRQETSPTTTDQPAVDWSESLADVPVNGRSSEGRSSEGRSSEGRSSEGRSSEGRSNEGRSSEGRSNGNSSAGNGVLNLAPQNQASRPQRSADFFASTSHPAPSADWPDTVDEPGSIPDRSREEVAENDWTGPTQLLGKLGSFPWLESQRTSGPNAAEVATRNSLGSQNSTDDHRTPDRIDRLPIDRQSSPSNRGEPHEVRADELVSLPPIVLPIKHAASVPATDGVTINTQDFLPLPIKTASSLPSPVSPSANALPWASVSQSVTNMSEDFGIQSRIASSAVAAGSARVKNSSISASFIQPTGSGLTLSGIESPLANQASFAAPLSNQLPTSPAGTPHVLLGAENFKLAVEPQFGDHWKAELPVTDPRAHLIEPLKHDFSPDPICLDGPYDAHADQQIYDGKKLYANQRPLIELGRPWYQLGQLSPGYNWLGKHNPVEPQFLIYGDTRTGFANNSQDGNSTALTAFQANLNYELKVTSTERFVMFASPFTNGVENTGFNFDDEEFVNNLNANILFGHLEGDLGALAGGFINETYPFEIPFSVGVMPLIFQNGVWLDDAILGFAFTIPSRSNALLDISNMDTTFFAGYDKVVSDAFPGDDSAAKIYGIATFIEALNSYIEIDYAFIEDRTFLDRSYHNLGVGVTRRFGRFVSNSTRMIINLGQNPNGIDQTADGVLLLSENSLITGHPSNIVPYFNLFAGFDRPQSAARNALAGGVLRNTGILFETDNLTGFPTLDPTANDTLGASFGLNLLAADFSQQLVLETSFLNVMGDDPNRNANGNQYGLGMRYQLPLTNALIFRADAMYGFLTGDEDIHGARVELRHKF